MQLLSHAETNSFLGFAVSETLCLIFETATNEGHRI
jgi:hypothetical protein